MKKYLIVLLLIMVCLTGCVDKNKYDSPDEYIVPTSIIEDNDEFFKVHAFDEKTMLIVNNVESFIYDIEKEEKTMIEGLSKDNVENLFQFDLENEKFYLYDETSVEILDFNGTVKNSLQADDGNMIIEWNGLWISTSSNLESEEPSPVKVYDDDFELVQELNGSLLQVGLGSLRRVNYGSYINTVFIISEVESNDMVYYYSQTESEFVASDIMYEDITSTTDSMHFKNTALIKEQRADDVINYYIYQEGYLTSVPLPDINQGTYILFNNYIVGLEPGEDTPHKIYDLEGTLLLEYYYSNSVIPQYLNDDENLYIEFDESTDSLIMNVKNFQGEVKATYDISEIEKFLPDTRKVCIVDENNLILQLSNKDILIRDSEIIELDSSQIDYHDSFCYAIDSELVYICREDEIITVEAEEMYSDFVEYKLQVTITEYYAIFHKLNLEDIYDVIIYDFNGTLKHDGYHVEKIYENSNMYLSRMDSYDYTLIYDTISETYVITKLR